MASDKGKQTRCGQCCHNGLLVWRAFSSICQTGAAIAALIAFLPAETDLVVPPEKAGEPPRVERRYVPRIVKWIGELPNRRDR